MKQVHDAEEYAALSVKREEARSNLILSQVLFFAGLLCLIFFGSNLFWLAFLMLLTGLLSYYSARRKLAKTERALAEMLTTETNHE